MLCLLSLAPLEPWQTRRYLALVLPNPSVLNPPVHLSLTCPKIMEAVRKLSPCSCVFTSGLWVKGSHSKQSQAHSATSGIGILVMWKGGLRDSASRLHSWLQGWLEPMMSVQNYQLLVEGGHCFPSWSVMAILDLSWPPSVVKNHLEDGETCTLEETSVLCASGL